jgi:hypothetical protein
MGLSEIMVHMRRITHGICSVRPSVLLSSIRPTHTFTRTSQLKTVLSAVEGLCVPPVQISTTPKAFILGPCAPMCSDAQKRHSKTQEICVQN